MTQLSNIKNQFPFKYIIQVIINTNYPILRQNQLLKFIDMRNRCGINSPSSLQHELSYTIFIKWQWQQKKQFKRFPDFFLHHVDFDIIQSFNHDVCRFYMQLKWLYDIWSIGFVLLHVQKGNESKRKWFYALR